MRARRPKRERFYNDEEFCTIGCGRSNRINPISLGRAQAELLIRLAHEFGGRATHEEMQLRRSDYSTINWLRYFELVERIDGEVGTFKVTDLGYAFLAGRHRILNLAWMFDSRILDYEDAEEVSIQMLLGKRYATYQDILTHLAEHHRIATREELDENMAAKGLPLPTQSRRRVVTRRPRESETAKEPSLLQRCLRRMPQPVALAPAEQDLRRHEPRGRRGSAQSKKPVERVRRDPAPKLTGDALHDYLDKKAGL